MITTDLQFKYSMKKTRRIVTISPTTNYNKQPTSHRQNLQKTQKSIVVQSSQHKQVKVHHINKIHTDLNKSLTPLKHAESSKNTRTSTSLKTYKQKGSNYEMSECKDTGEFESSVKLEFSLKEDYKNSIRSIENSEEQIKNSQIKSNHLMESTQQMMKQNHIEAILKKINSHNNRGLSESNPSIFLYKKMEISKLREMLESGKFLYHEQGINMGDYLEKIHHEPTFTQINHHKADIKCQVKQAFDNLRDLLDKRQKQIDKSIQENFFKLEEKHANKILRLEGLQNFIQQCEADINKNYQKIVEELEITKFQKIIQAYTNRMKYYAEKAQQNYMVKLQIPSNLQSMLSASLSNICLQLHTQSNNQMKENAKALKSSQVNPQHQRFKSSHPNLNRGVNLCKEKKENKIESILSSRLN